MYLIPVPRIHVQLYVGRCICRELGICRKWQLLQFFPFFKARICTGWYLSWMYILWTQYLYLVLLSLNGFNFHVNFLGINLLAFEFNISEFNNFFWTKLSISYIWKIKHIKVWHADYVSIKTIMSINNWMV